MSNTAAVTCVRPPPTSALSPELVLAGIGEVEVLARVDQEQVLPDGVLRVADLPVGHHVVHQAHYRTPRANWPT